jgi:hypothetical protein
MSRVDQAKLLAKTSSQLSGATILAAIALFGGGAEFGDRKMNAALLSSVAFLVVALIFHLVADWYEPEKVKNRQFANNKRKFFEALENQDPEVLGMELRNDLDDPLTHAAMETIKPRATKP